jgi:hypothetical protein
MQHCPIAQASWRPRVWCCKQRSDLLPCQIVDKLDIRPLDRQRPDHHGLFKACRAAMLDETEESFNSREPGISGASRIGPPFLHMFQESSHQSNIEILDHEIGGLPLEPSGGETQQERERMRVAGDSMRARATFVWKIVLQECREVWSKWRHNSAP